MTARIAVAALITPAVVILGTQSSMAASNQVVTPASIITTLTGNGVAGFSGDGGPAGSAQVNLPRDAAVGPDGSVYIADTFNNRVRVIDIHGVIHTYAGDGLTTFGGDGGPAVNASLQWPHDLTVDKQGDLYIADAAHDRIREVTPNGIITTVAGNGVGSFGGDGGPAVQAQLKNPKSVALMGGSLYFADSLNQRIRAVDLATGIIRTVAGNGVAGFAGDGGPATSASLNVPQRLAFDTAGDLFVADTLNNRIREVTPDGVIHTVVGTGVGAFGGDGGPGTAARVSVPKGLAEASDGSLFFSDSGNNRVRRWDPATGIVTTIVGTGVTGYSGDNGPAALAQLYNPRGLSFDAAGQLIIADAFNNAIRIVSVGTSSKPTASFTVSCPYMTCSFDGTASTAPASTITSYSWDFGDGSPTGSGATVQHSYPTAGQHSATLTVTSALALTASTTRDLSTSLPNPPSASYTQACSGLTCTLDGSSSSSTGSFIASYHWDFGDGATSDTGPTSSHAYAAPGPYTVSLTVTDGFHQSGTHSFVIAVQSGSSATLTVTCTLLHCAGDASGSTLPNIAQYSWDFGDGSPIVVTTTPTSAHVYSAAGVHLIRLTVSDGVGGSASAWQNVDVVGPTASFTWSCHALTCSFDASASKAPGASLTSYLWDFADGTTSSGVTAGKSFTAAGNYVVTLTVVDSLTETATAAQTVTAVDAPVASFTASCSTETCAFDASASTSSGPRTMTWDFGDGSAAGTGERPGHTYATAAAYPVTVTVTDSYGNVASLTRSITVAAPPIAFVGAASVAANATTETVTIPTAAATGVGLILIATGASVTAQTAPTGWQLVKTAATSSMRSSIWERIAGPGDAGSPVTVKFGSTVIKGTLEVLAYSGTSPSGVLAAVPLAGTGVTATASFTTPTTSNTTPGAWILSYWSCRSTSVTGWTPPLGQTSRSKADGTGGGHIDAVATDSANPVALGSVGALTGSTNQTSASQIAWTLILAPKS